MTAPRSSTAAPEGDARQTWTAFQREWADESVYSSLVRLSGRASAA